MIQRGSKQFRGGLKQLQENLMLKPMFLTPHPCGIDERQDIQGYGMDSNFISLLLLLGHVRTFRPDCFNMTNIDFDRLKLHLYHVGMIIR